MLQISCETCFLTQISWERRSQRSQDSTALERTTRFQGNTTKDGWERDTKEAENMVGEDETIEQRHATTK